MNHSSPRRGFLHRFLVAGGAGVAASPAVAAQAAAARLSIHNVTAYGAAGDGTRLETRPIQNAIDDCARRGGLVYFPAGTWLSGTLFLKSNVFLYLDAGATLLGSKDLNGYPVTVQAFRSYTDNYTDKSLIYAENLDNIGILGHGVIDGQGASFKGPYKVRPYLVRVIQCRDVTVSGVTIRNSPMWVQHYLACDGVLIRGIRVHSRVNSNNDGIDIDCCERVCISDCDISSGDDAIVLKSTADRPTRNVTVTNCVLSSHCNALKMGTETNGGFENIAISNCTVYDTRLAGLTLQIVDGGILDRVTVSGLAMRNVGAPIFIRLGNRARPFQEDGPRPGIGRLGNVVISGIEAVGASKTGCAIAGLPGHVIENVTLDNIRLRFTGGGSAEDASRDVPENPDKYPEFNMFGALPAYGLYVRHARNVTLRNLHAAFEQNEARPALICDDVQGLELAGCSLDSPEDGPAIRLHQSRDVFIHGCRVPRPVRVFLHAAGPQTQALSLIGNDLGKARQPVETAPDVPSGALFLDANRISPEAA